MSLSLQDLVLCEGRTEPASLTVISTHRAQGLGRGVCSGNKAEETGAVGGGGGEAKFPCYRKHTRMKRVVAEIPSKLQLKFEGGALKCKSPTLSEIQRATEPRGPSLGFPHASCLFLKKGE